MTALETLLYLLGLTSPLDAQLERVMAASSKGSDECGE